MLGHAALSDQPLSGAEEEIVMVDIVGPSVELYSIDITSNDAAMAHGSDFEVVVDSYDDVPTTGNTLLVEGNDSIAPTSVTGSGPHTLTFPISLLNKVPASYLWNLTIAGEIEEIGSIPYTIAGNGTTEFYGTITSLIGAWANAAYSAFEVGDNIYAIRTAGTGDAEVATGVFPEGTTWSIYNQDVNDGVWGTVGTLVVPSITPGGDVTKPIITLLGSATVAHAQQAPYTDAGATATDETDGTLTNDIVVSGDTVDVNTVGSYVIRYNVSDAAGNAATEVTRTVDVLADPIPPVITVTGSTSIQLVLDATYTELGATWTDNVDGAGAATVGGDTVDTSTAGTYVVTYNHTDEAGNPATQRTRTVKIGGAVSTLIVSDFPATKVVTANDLQQPLIKLHQLCRRSSAGVARQIEEHVNTIYFLMPNALTGTPPDATVAATAQLKALYVAFTGFDRAWRIKMERVRKLSANVAVQAAMAAQLQYWLEKQGWTFA